MTKTMIIQLILAYSQAMDFDGGLAVAVAQTESSLIPTTIGQLNEVGLFQIRPEYSKYSSKQLTDVHINIQEGINKLKHSQKYCKHKDGYHWVICYNLGVAGASNIKYPHLFPYYKKIKQNMKEVQNEYATEIYKKRRWKLCL